MKTLIINLAVISSLISQPAVLAQGYEQPTLGQSDWQTVDQNTNQYQNQASQQYQSNSQLGQSDWQMPNANAGANQGSSQYSNQMPSQNNWQSSANLGQSDWQQPQSAFQANTAQQSGQSSDYYYGQANQNNQPQVSQSQANQPQANQLQANQFQNNQFQNNQSFQSNNQTPQQQGKVQKSHDGLKRALVDITKAVGTGVGATAPLAGYMLMSRAMYGGYGGYGMPYGGYGMGMPYGYGMPYGGYGMGMPYGMMGNPYFPMGGLSSFMHY